MMRLFLFFLCSFLVACSVGDSPFDSFQGEWVSKRAAGVYYENWTKLNDAYYSGHSCLVNGSDTVSQESFALVKKVDKWILTVNGSGFEPIDFPVTQYDNGTFTAENPDNDFPKVITYETTESGLQAFITNGEQDTIRFDFKPLK